MSESIICKGIIFQVLIGFIIILTFISKFDLWRYCTVYLYCTWAEFVFVSRLRWIMCLAY